MIARTLNPTRTFLLVIRGDEMIRAGKAVILLKIIRALKLFDDCANPHIEPICFPTDHPCLLQHTVLEIGIEHTRGSQQLLN